MSAPNAELLDELYAVLSRVPVVASTSRSLDSIRQRLELARAKPAHPLTPMLLREAIGMAQQLLNIRAAPTAGGS